LKAMDKPFLLASGGNADSAPDAHRDAPMLAKPYTMDGVRAALDALT